MAKKQDGEWQRRESWPRIAVLGAGAVGCYFGGMLARAGAPVILIGRKQHVEAINRNGLLLETSDFQQKIQVSASTDVSAARDAEIVLFCVKTMDTEEAAKCLAACILPNALVLSLQNGADNVERIRSASGIDAIAAVVYVAAAMAGPGHVKHHGRGDLVLGDLPGRPETAEPRPDRLEEISAAFASCGVPCRVSENIQGELWTKMIINCAYNAISALGRARYRQIGSNPWTRQLMIQVIGEAVAVAGAAGVRLPGSNMTEAGLKVAETMANATSSTAQDLARGKRTEIDSLNGYLVRRGKDFGVATPVNQTLHALVKLLEESVQSNAVFTAAGQQVANGL
ncbi:MAG: ketopantoate reductase family protein [Terriglobia bacterium]